MRRLNARPFVQNLRIFLLNFCLLIILSGTCIYIFWLMSEDFEGITSLKLNPKGIKKFVYSAKFIYK